mgnify:CR=1 FL=1
MGLFRHCTKCDDKNVHRAEYTTRYEMCVGCVTKEKETVKVCPKCSSEMIIDNDELLCVGMPSCGTLDIKHLRDLETF